MPLKDGSAPLQDFIMGIENSPKPMATVVFKIFAEPRIRGLGSVPSRGSWFGEFAKVVSMPEEKTLGQSGDGLPV